MEKRPGRFEVDIGKTMRVGTDIYREIIKKMLSVHIATMERKMRACQRCPPRCPALPGPAQSQEEHPYTKPYKDEPFIPRTMLPSYIQLKLAKRERGKTKLRTEEEAKIRKEYEAIEDRLRKHKGVISAARQEERDARAVLQAQINSLRKVDDPDTIDELDPASDDEREEQRLHRIEYLVTKLRDEQLSDSHIRQIIQRLKDLNYEGVDSLEYPQQEDLDEATPVPDTAPRDSGLAREAEPAEPETPAIGPGQPGPLQLVSPVPGPDFTDPDAREIAEADANAVLQEEAHEAAEEAVQAPPALARPDVDTEKRPDVQPEPAAEEAEMTEEEQAAAKKASDEKEEKTETVDPDAERTDEEPDEENPQLAELVNFLATKLAMVDEPDVKKRQVKRKAWKRSKFLKELEMELPEWARANIWAKGNQKRRKSLPPKLINDFKREGLDNWADALEIELSQSKYAWIFGGEYAAPRPRKKTALPEGFTGNEHRVLFARLGKWWTHWVRGLNEPRTAKDFVMTPFAPERFHELVKLFDEAEHLTKTTTYSEEERAALDQNFLMRMRDQFYKVCRETEEEGGRIETYPEDEVSTIEQFVARSEQETAKALDRMIWVVPPEVQQIPDWPVPGALLEVEVYGPDFIRCPVWKNSVQRVHLYKGRRWAETPDHRAFKQADAVRYNLPDNEYVDVTMSWPLGVPQHFECYCFATQGASEQPIFIPGTQLRVPTAEERKATDFFDLADSVGVEEDESLSSSVYATPNRARSGSSSRVSIGNYYVSREPLSRLTSPQALPMPPTASPSLLPVHSPEIQARLDVPLELRNIVSDSEADVTPAATPKR